MDFLSRHSGFGSDDDDDDDDVGDFLGAQKGVGLKSLFVAVAEKSPSHSEAKISNGNEGQKKKIESEQKSDSSAPSLKMSGPILVDAFVYDKASNGYKPMGKAGRKITVLLPLLQLLS